MKIQINTITSSFIEINIEAEWQSISSQYNLILSNYSKIAIKGFRSGKTPLKLIEQQFSTNILNDVGVSCAQNLLKEAMLEKGLKTGSPISISEISIKKNEPFLFKAQLVLMPEFELPKYLGLGFVSLDQDERKDEISDYFLSNSQIIIPDEMVNQELELTGLEPKNASQDEKTAAKNRVILLLILKKIADQDGIEVDEKDLEERISWVAKQNGTNSSTLKQMLLSNGGLSRLANYLLAERVLDYIIENGS